MASSINILVKFRSTGKQIDKEKRPSCSIGPNVAPKSVWTNVYEQN